MTPKNLPTPEFHAVPPLGMDADTLALDARRYYSHFLGRGDHSPDTFDLYRALSLALRDRLMERWNRTRAGIEAADARQAYYLSMEFLMGRTHEQRPCSTCALRKGIPRRP
jgi:starch phosphorylase